MDAIALRRCVEEVVTETPVIDMHTHLFAPQFGKLGLWGIDDLLNYHYLIAELFRSSTVTPERFWALAKAEQADLIWKELFVRNTPLSEATRGVVAVLTALGLDARAPDLSEARAFYQAQRVDNYLNRVLELARVDEIVMTNDPFDEEEANLWKRSLAVDARFHAALRLDPLLNEWSRAMPKIIAQGYDHVRADLENETVADLRRFLDEWIARMRPVYLAVSLPDTFTYPERSVRNRLITEVVLPTCREHKLPFTMMIGVRRSVNPALRGAGDGMGRADVSAVERLCRDYPDNRFLVTMLSRENQHELCVTARKFSNVMPFGCWWFVNNPSIVSEITRERVEMLGTSFIPQHSDARVLDQLIYKWRHARGLIAEVLYDSYHRLLDDGRPVTRPEIERDAARLFSENFREWVGQLG
jgi:hypothetical protein